MRTLITADRLTVWFSRRDIAAWLGGPARAHDRSVLEGRRVVVSFSSHGMEGLEVDGREPRVSIPENELSALVVDHLRDQVPQDHPVFFAAIGQFIQHEGGYTACACRDCFEVALGMPGLALCGDCSDADCERGHGECRAPVDLDDETFI